MLGAGQIVSQIGANFYYAVAIVQEASVELFFNTTIVPAVKLRLFPRKSEEEVDRARD